MRGGQGGLRCFDRPGDCHSGVIVGPAGGLGRLGVESVFVGGGPVRLRGHQLVGFVGVCLCVGRRCLCFCLGIGQFVAAEKVRVLVRVGAGGGIV